MCFENTGQVRQCVSYQTCPAAACKVALLSKCTVCMLRLELRCLPKIISRACNVADEMAMRTTELSAVAALQGEIIKQMGPNLSERVAFASVREKVRRQLHTAADDPDLPDLYDFLICNGVGTVNRTW